MGVSENRGIPKWMVYNGKPLLRWMIWGETHYFWKHLYWHPKTISYSGLLYTSFYCCTCFLQKQVHTARLEEVGQKNKFLNWITFFLVSWPEFKASKWLQCYEPWKQTSFSVVSNTINQPTWSLHYVASSLSVLSPQIIAPKTNNNHGLLRNSHQESKTQVDPFQPFQKSPPSSPFCSYLKKKRSELEKQLRSWSSIVFPQNKKKENVVFFWDSTRLVGWSVGGSVDDEIWGNPVSLGPKKPPGIGPLESVWYP